MNYFSADWVHGGKSTISSVYGVAQPTTWLEGLWKMKALNRHASGSWCRCTDTDSNWLCFKDEQGTIAWVTCEWWNVPFQELSHNRLGSSFRFLLCINSTDQYLLHTDTIDRNTVTWPTITHSDGGNELVGVYDHGLGIAKQYHL